MTLTEAQTRIRSGARFGDVFPDVAEADHAELRRWFVFGHEWRPEPRAVVGRRGSSPIGNPCPQCGGGNLVRTGSCVTCQDCGVNEGCG